MTEDILYTSPTSWLNILIKIVTQNQREITLSFQIFTKELRQIENLPGYRDQRFAANYREILKHLANLFGVNSQSLKR